MPNHCNRRLHIVHAVTGTQTVSTDKSIGVHQAGPVQVNRESWAPGLAYGRRKNIVAHKDVQERKQHALLASAQRLAWSNAQSLWTPHHVNLADIK